MKMTIKPLVVLMTTGLLLGSLNANAYQKTCMMEKKHLEICMKKNGKGCDLKGLKYAFAKCQMNAQEEMNASKHDKMFEAPSKKHTMEEKEGDMHKAYKSPAKKPYMEEKESDMHYKAYKTPAKKPYMEEKEDDMHYKAYKTPAKAPMNKAKETGMYGNKVEENSKEINQKNNDCGTLMQKYVQCRHAILEGKCSRDEAFSLLNMLKQHGCNK